MTDAPKTIAEMREAAAKVADTLHYPDETKISASIRDAIRAIPLPANDAEMEERVADCEEVFNAAQAYRHCPLTNQEEAIAAYRALIRAALSAIRGEP